ncbi:MAG: hypothetical protein ACI8QC_003572, partial [Planctomycetota bacterium]
MNNSLSAMLRANCAALSLVFFGGALQAQSSAPDATRQEGETLSADAWSPLRYVDLRELHELEKLKPAETTIRRTRGEAHGAWVVPSEGGSAPAHSGARYITNKWGDTSMGIRFPELVDVKGAWILGQSAPEAWTPSLVVVGYRNGVEVGRSPAFTSIGSSPAWFAMGLVGVDRVVFEASVAVEGAGWYGLDDLTYSTNGSQSEQVLDFEDLLPRATLSGTSYAGLSWELGTGTFEQKARVVEQPLFPGAGLDLNQPPGNSTHNAGGGGTAPNLIQDFKGAQLFDTGAGFIPPDTCGTIAPNHFVEVVNANLSVYDRTTQNRVVNVALSSFFGAGVGDPRVVWDHISDRCYILATDFSSRIYLAVSLTDDPSGTYFTTSFATDGGSDAGRWPDYPTLGFDENGIYTCIGQFGGSPVTMTIFAIDKAPLVAAAPSFGTLTAFRGFGFEGAIQPAVTFGNPGRQYFISRNNSSSLRLREITPPLTSPTLTDLGTVSIPSHSFPPDVDSMGSGVPLDSVDHRPMNSVFRNGSIWTAHAVGVSGRAAVRWYEIDPLTASTVQVGTIDDPVLGFVMPSVSVNSLGDAVIAFSGSSSSQFAAAYFTGRLATDPLGEVATPILYKAGEGSYQNLDSFGRNRWGDYSLTSIDPVDDLTFWTVQEYAQPSNRWGTWMAELAYPAGITDCNGNGVEDADDIANGTSLDCNSNGIPDECEPDCDADGIPDDCEVDCNANGTPDDCETFTDCNNNGIPDECEPDCDGDGIPDDCEVDCNANGTPDDCETFTDCNNNGIPDECEPDCDGDGIPDDCEVDCNANGTPDDCETFTDCNNNGIPDECEPDCDSDGLPDDCEVDCNANGIPDDCETFTDCNNNGIPDECEPDCDGDGIPDDCEIDCNANGTPDDCETFTDCNNNGIPDECEPDCDGDGIPDDCEI